MSDRARRVLWFAAWLAALVLCGTFVAQSLRIGSDLRLFLPEAATPEQALLLEGIGEGPASRMLVIALDGADPDALAATSQALADRLRGHPEFLSIDNGSAAALPEFVLRYRFLLSPAMDRRRLDAATLRDALLERLQDLGTPAGPLLEPLIPADPTLESLSVVEGWAAGAAPHDGAWAGAGGRALLVAQTRAAAFDPDGQQRALDALTGAFEEVRTDPALRLTASGPGRFSALMKERTQRDAAKIGAAASAMLVVLLLAAYRRWRVLALAGLPLATAGLAGLAAVTLLYGEVHAITLAFGFTLIGVAQDYPIHLFSHQHAGLAPADNVRELWPTLATGVASTCVAYLAFLASGVAGLAQLGWFTIFGLAAAGLTTRYLLPRIAGAGFDDTARSPFVQRADRALSMREMPRWLYTGLAAAALLAAAAAPGPFWEDDLGALTPVPRELLEQDAALRRELGAPDARYLAAVVAPTEQEALARLESLTPGLEELATDGALGGFLHAARFLPSAARQRQRQAALPGDAELAAALAEAMRGLPFRAGVFDPFLEDVARARSLAPLEPADLRAAPQGAMIAGLLRPGVKGVVAPVAFSGVTDAAALERWAAAAGVTLVDLKRASESLVARQRARILLCLAAAAVLLAAVVRAGLRDWGRALRVLAPVALATVAVIGALRLAGEGLNLFHLVSLVLAAGLGLDYALFMERAGGARERRLRTLHAVLVCSASTFAVFALLLFSSIPVLRSIGLTVALGVLFNFLLALALPRSRSA